MWKWCTDFNSGREPTHDEEQSDHLLVITEETIDSVKEKIIRPVIH